MGVAGNNIPVTLQPSNIKSGVSIFGVAGTLVDAFSISGGVNGNLSIVVGGNTIYYRQYGKQYFILGSNNGGTAYRLGSYSYLTQTATAFATALGGTLKGYMYEAGLAAMSCRYTEHNGTSWVSTSNSNWAITMIELN